MTHKFIAPKIDAAPDKCKLKILGIDEFTCLRINFNAISLFFYWESPTTVLNKRFSTHWALKPLKYIYIENCFS